MARLVVAVGVVAFVGYLVAGYGEGWAWTGLSRPVTLWDWLEGLALPVTVGLVPLFLRHREHLHRTHKLAALTALAVFAVLVLLGYLLPMPWTGFTGNTLWDWLSLALLPLVIATATLWRRPPAWTRQHLAAVGGCALVTVLVVIAGYLVPWALTGFTGNTAWDWIKLLLLPVLLPTVVMPRLLSAADEWMTPEQARNPRNSLPNEADTTDHPHPGH